MQTSHQSNLLSALLLTTISLTMFGCISERLLLSGPATIIHSGRIESNGCGWLVEMGGELYFPREPLPSEFQENGRSVTIEYEKTEFLRACGFSSMEYPEIAVFQIIE